MTNQTLELWQIWQCLQNGKMYQVISLEDGEVVATTEIGCPGQPFEAPNSFIWLSSFAEFLQAFKFVKMGPKPKGL